MTLTPFTDPPLDAVCAEPGCIEDATTVRPIMLGKFLIGPHGITELMIGDEWVCHEHVKEWA